MVVLAAAVVTKTGEAVVSRQFVEMTRSRIEGLLASFPKLIANESGGGGRQQQQHTFVETETVRFLYQPLDGVMYMVLITNRHSNILQDMETLSLFSRLVSDYCRTLKQPEVARAAFDLLMAFDEVVALGGTREPVTLQQIRLNLEMDSHEECLQEMLQKSKERDAIEAAKLKAKQLDMQKRDARKRTSQITSPTYSTTSTVSAPSSSSLPQQPPFQPHQQSHQQQQKKGMQLGAKSKQAGLFDSLKTEEGLTDDLARFTADTSQLPTSPIQQHQPHSHHQPLPQQQQQQQQPVQMGDVHLTLDEKLSASLNRDGGLVDSLEIKGDLLLRITNPDYAPTLRVECTTTPDAALTFKTHPNVDKNQWTSASVIAPKDASKPFVVGTVLPVLKWRYVTKQESMIPLLVSVWPSPSPDASALDVCVEYELLSESHEVRDVVISIPIVGGHAPKVDSVDGEYAFNPSSRSLDWKIPMIDPRSSSTTSGTLEFSLSGSGGDGEHLFPVKVAFTSQHSFCGVSVNKVLVDAAKEVAYTSQVTVQTDDYKVV